LGPGNSFSVGLMGSGECLNTSSILGLITGNTGGACDGGGGFGAGTVAYSGTGA
jgi:hypothetical protein